MAVKLGALCLLFLFIGQAYGHFFPFFHFDTPTEHEKSSDDLVITGEGGSSASTSDGYTDFTTPINGGSGSTDFTPINDGSGSTDFTPINDGSGSTSGNPLVADYNPIEITDPVTEPLSKQPNNFETNYKGDWEIFIQKAGVAAMHLQVFPNNKAVMFDTTILGDSLLPLPKGEPCVSRDPEKPHILDCTAHSAEIDLATGAIRPLVVHTDTWCSSAGLDKNGVLVQAGGYITGGRVVRYLDQCATCDWKEYPDALTIVRWYATQQVLPDGSFVVVGGRDGFSYEYVPAPGKNNAKAFQLPFLMETRDNITTGKDLKGREIQDSENNLYPHVHLSTDGNLFIFANYRSILLDPKKNKIIRRFPDLPGGARNYPGSAPSVVLPIKVPSKMKAKNIPVEVAICGGGKKDAYLIAKVKKQFVPALQTCGRIKITDANAKWKIELMPAPRVMGDMLILPTGDMLILNGAKSGSGGWEYAEDPYLSPVLYSPSKPKAKRFQELAPSNIPRMYHSSAAVLTDGKILVAGSSTHQGYKFHGVKYPTELRIEKFSPHYLDPTLAPNRPEIFTNFDGKKFAYNQQFLVDFNVIGGSSVKNKDIKVTIYSPPFTTHSYSMNQRMIVLAKGKLTQEKSSSHRIQVTAPPSGAVAPPGYYMLFVVYRGLPSQASWIKIY